MHRVVPKPVVTSFLLMAILGALMLTGCDFLDPFTGGGGTGTTNAPQAVMTLQLDDPMVNNGSNPDHHPPLSYNLSALDSLDLYGDPIRRGVEEVAWDFGDGETRGFEWGDYTSRHSFREEGPITITLTVREPEAYGGGTDTAQQTITLGPAWLKILSVAKTEQADGTFEISVVVKNQSRQVLGRLGLDLVGSDGWVSAVDLNLGDTAEDGLAPNATYTITKNIGEWNGLLRVRSGWCYPIPDNWGFAE